MAHYVDKAALVAEIERRKEYYENIQMIKPVYESNIEDFSELLSFIKTLEVKEVDLEKEIKEEYLKRRCYGGRDNMLVILNEPQFNKIAKHFFELGLKAQHDNWKVVDNINLPQADKNKIYCVFTKDRYILAKVINHPKDEELLQWKCTEFPHHRYDMCEGDEYMQIV